MNIDNLRKSYSKLSETKLENLIKGSFNDLTPVAIIVLEEELIKRKSSLILEFKKRLRRAEELQYLIDEKCAEIRNFPCPICKSEAYKLNAIELKTPKFNDVKLEFFLGCYECLYKAFVEVRDKHNMLGAGILGVFDAHKLLIENEKQLEELKLDKPTSTLREYVKEYIMYIYYGNLD